MINDKFKTCKFIAGANNVKQIPTLLLPEIAFAGRSNVGKSSLLNILTLQKNLARTSKTPGRTQQINFFQIPHLVTLVDLPGYGYSKVSKSTINNWADFIARYISSREQLEHLFLLIDSRRNIQKSDRAVINWLEHYKINHSIILTKTDKLKQTEVEEMITNLNEPTKIITHAISNKTSIGISKLRKIILNLAVNNSKNPNATQD